MRCNFSALANCSFLQVWLRLCIRHFLEYKAISLLFVQCLFTLLLERWALHLPATATTTLETVLPICVQHLRRQRSRPAGLGGREKFPPSLVSLKVRFVIEFMVLFPHSIAESRSHLFIRSRVAALLPPFEGFFVSAFRGHHGSLYKPLHH